MYNAEVTASQRQLDSLNTISNDSTKSILIRKLYRSAKPGTRNAICRTVLSATRKILLFNNSIDTGLLPFYYQLAVDSTLTVENRNFVNVQIAGYFAHIVMDADSASYYINRVHQNPKKPNDSLNAKLYSAVAQVYQLRGQMKEASASLYRSLSYYDRIKDSTSIAGVQGNLANVYRSMSDYRKSIELRKKVLAYFTRMQMNEPRAVSMQGLASDFLAVHQVDSGRRYFIEAEQLFAQGVKSPVAEYYLYISKAGMYVDLKRLDSSVIYFDKAKELLPLFDERQELLFTISSAIAYSSKRDVRKEAQTIEAYIPQLFTEDNLPIARDAYFSLYNIALAQKIRHEAIEYYRLYDSLRTVLADNQNREFVAELESKYESQKKALTIQVQKKEIDRRKTLNLILILSIAMVLLASSFLIARLQLLRSRKEAKLQQQFTRKLLKNTEEERRRIAADLHDGIGHELLSLKNNLQQGTTASENKINDIINDVRMISRNLHPAMLDQIGLEYSVQHLCEQVMASGKLFLSAEIDYNNQLSRDDEVQLYRIIQESVTNVIKYAGALAAKIEIITKNDRLAVTIMDNGKGFDVEEKMHTQSAFGLNSMIQRGKALGGKITISSTDQGTIINLEIPINNAVAHNS